MKSMTQTIKTKYYRYNPGEFLPIYEDGKLANSKDFHRYRIKWLIDNRQAAVYQFTHTRG